MTTFKDLNTILNWPDLYAPSKTFFLVRDTFTADGSFLLHHFLNSYLLSSQQQQQQKNTHVKFVSLNQSYFHYSTIELKLNVNLQKEGEEGRFMFIDAQEGLLSHCLDDLSNNGNVADGNTNTTTTTTSATKMNPLTFTSPIHVRTKVNVSPPKGLIQWTYNLTDDQQQQSESSSSSLPPLFLSLLKTIESSSPVSSTSDDQNKSKCSCLIIDHLDVLMMYSKDGQRDIFKFVQRLLAWANQNDTSLVLLMHGDSEANHVANLIEQYADIVFRVGGLPTGYSKDVHGMVEVLCEKRNQMDTTANAAVTATATATAQTNNVSTDLRLLTRQTLHYKCFEHNVTLFAPGSHSGII